MNKIDSMGVRAPTLRYLFVIDKCHPVIRMLAAFWFDVHGAVKPDALARPFQKIVLTLVQKLP